MNGGSLPIVDAFGYGWQNAMPALRATRTPVLIGLGGTVLLTIAQVWLFAALPEPRFKVSPDDAAGFASAIAAIWVLQTAIRRANPAFRYTLGNFVASFAWTLLYVLITFAGLVLLIVTGVWLGTRLFFGPYVRLIEDGPHPANPFVRSLSLTEGAFWSTLVFVIALFVLGEVTDSIINGFVEILRRGGHDLGFGYQIVVEALIVAPIAFLLLIFLEAVWSLATVYFYLALCAREGDRLRASAGG